MVSVIIPTYNRAETIKRSVYSVLNQTYRDLECIVIDDGSIDNTEAVVKNIDDPRFRYYRMKENSGACAARNKGISLANGEFIAFQDSDDVWRDNKLKVQLDAISKSNADVCFCSIRRFDVNHKNSVKWPIGLEEGVVPYNTLYESPRTSTQTILAKKYVFDNFNFDEKVKKAQDYDWTLRAGEKYTFFYISDMLVDQYLQKDSITTYGEKNYQSTKENNQYLYDKYKKSYKKYPKLEAVLLERLAFFKVLAGDNAAEEYKRLYKLTKKKTEYLKYMAEKTIPGILRDYFLYRHKGTMKRQGIS